MRSWSLRPPYRRTGGSATVARPRLNEIFACRWIPATEFEALSIIEPVAVVGGDDPESRPSRSEQYVFIAVDKFVVEIA
jgi:hypothetical protein